MNAVNLLDAFLVKPLCSGFWVFFSCSSSLSFIMDSNILENVLVTTIPLLFPGIFLSFPFSGRELVFHFSCYLECPYLEKSDL